MSDEYVLKYIGRFASFALCDQNISLSVGRKDRLTVTDYSLLITHYSSLPNSETPGSPSIRKILHQEFRCPLYHRQGSEYLRDDPVNSSTHYVQ